MNFPQKWKDFPPKAKFPGNTILANLILINVQNLTHLIVKWTVSRLFDYGKSLLITNFYRDDRVDIQTGQLTRFMYSH